MPPSQTPTPAPDSLHQVVEAFTHWRTQRKGRGRIPEALWEQALSLVGHYPVTKITAALGLDFSAFKQRCNDRDLPLRKTKAPAFVEVLASSAPPSPLALPIHIEVARHDGTTLRLQCAEPTLALQCLAQFLRS